MDAKVRIVLSDDHPVVRKGLKLSIEEDESFDVIGEAGDGEAAWSLVQKLDPDLALLDVEMPKLSGLDVAGKIREAGLKTHIIFLSFSSFFSFSLLRHHFCYVFFIFCNNRHPVTGATPMYMYRGIGRQQHNRHHYAHQPRHHCYIQ